MDGVGAGFPGPENAARTYQHLLDSQRACGVGSWELNIETGEIWVSDEIYRMFGLPPGSLRTIEDFVATRSPERREILKAALAESIRTRVPLGYEAPAERPDGQTCWVRGKGAVFLDEAGRITRMVGTLEDITELKLAQQEVARKTAALEAANAELKRLDRQKDRFLALVSHELRTPLTTIRGVLNMLNRPGVDAVAYHRRIALATDTLANLVNDLLSAAQLQSGLFVLSRHAFRPAELIADVHDEVAPLAEAKGIGLHGGIDGDLGEIVGDRHRLAQVLRNLLLNAVRHTPEGGEVRLRAVAGDGALVLTVADTGEGLSPEARDRLFERFASYGAEDGVGLGLFVVKALVEAHGGTVTVESTPEAGTTFTVTLPGG